MSQPEKMYIVLSGNLNRIGWYENKKKPTLRVEFNNGLQYDYTPVPREKFLEIFNETESKGRWFAVNIKGDPKIKYKKVPEEEKTL